MSAPLLRSERIARALIDEARKALLVNCVETYLKLDESEQKLYERLVEQVEQKEVREMLTVYEQRDEIRGKRDATLRLLRKKFGDLPESVEARIQAMETEAELDALFDAALDAQSLDDLGFKKSKRTARGRKV
jgi:hypothetical protein